MDRTEAISIVREYVKNENLIRHMLAVEAGMRFYAELYGEDEEVWGITGLLHDFDWEIHPTLEQHPQEGAIILRERGVPEEIVHAILSHADHTGVPRTTSFAAGANREEITRATEEFGVDLWEHVGNVINAMQRIAPDLGLAGEQ
jgi:putative nucleotidyltransferase with HDIG domain